jgi:hypothetical protein
MRSSYIASSSAVQIFRTRFCRQPSLENRRTPDLLGIFDFLEGLTRGWDSNSLEAVVGFCSIEESDGAGLSFDRLGICEFHGVLMNKRIMITRNRI